MHQSVSHCPLTYIKWITNSLKSSLPSSLLSNQCSTYSPSPRYNRNRWLGVKHQVTYLLSSFPGLLPPPSHARMILQVNQTNTHKKIKVSHLPATCCILDAVSHLSSGCKDNVKILLPLHQHSSLHTVNANQTKRVCALTPCWESIE